MPIAFACPCGKLYQVADEYAGQQARCPSCGKLMLIPSLATQSITDSDMDWAGSAKSVAMESETGPVAGLGNETQWHLHSHDGQQYGPVTRQTLDEWLESGLITDRCQVMPDGGQQWQSASTLFPQLNPAAAQAPAVAEPSHLPTPGVQSTGAQPVGDPSSGQTTFANYRPILKSAGRSKMLRTKGVISQVKDMPGASLISSEVYKVGEKRSWLQQMRDSAVFGPVQEQETHVDLLQAFHFRDSLGEFVAIVGFDNGCFVPIEFVAKMSGCLPASMSLLKHSGGKVGLVPGAVMGGVTGAIVERIGTKVKSVWFGRDPSSQSFVEQAQQTDSLHAGINWEGKLTAGPVVNIFDIPWGIQALPLDPQSYLLVGRTVPKQKVIGTDFRVPWFQAYRKMFSQFISRFGVNQSGQFQMLDPGLWYSVAFETTNWLK